MSPTPVTAVVVLTAASSSLFLAGCGAETGGGGGGEEPITASPDTTTPEPEPEEDATTTHHDDRPQSKCCWSGWGNHWDCANYPSGGNGGLCNNDITVTCGNSEDCSDLAPPATTPPPPTTTRTRPTTTTTTLPEGACVKTASTGCLNGESFIFNEKFVCGKGANVGVHKWGEASCCAQGLVYDPHQDFCCNSALSKHSDGQCHEFDPSDDPPGCRCPSTSALGTEMTEMTEMTVGAEDTVIIDTQDWRTPAEHPCLFAGENGMGCFNGFLFDPVSDLLCGQYIVKGDTHGCCPTHDGIKAYNLQTESCCQFGGDADVRPNSFHAGTWIHQCQCRDWPNPHCSGLMFTA